MSTVTRPAVFLAGNISEGFTAFGPYEDVWAAVDANDGVEGWVMEMVPDKDDAA